MKRQEANDETGAEMKHMIGRFGRRQTVNNRT